MLHRPGDLWQFCAKYFNEKLEEQRNMFIELIKQQHPDILMSDDNHQQGVMETGDSSASMAQAHPQYQPPPQFSFQNPFDSDSQPNNAAGFGARMSMPQEAINRHLNDLRKAHRGVDPRCNYNRRFSVSAESMNPTKDEHYEKKVIPKTADQRKRIDRSLARNFLFANLDEESYEDIVNAMEEKRVKAGEDVIVQGGFGDFFYIVEHGTFDIFVSKDGKKPEQVASVSDGGSFGELALMYNAPRAATVHARTDATLWALDRITFRRLLME
ncbi:hypothetical protein EV182_007145, partial [Spiromyces aspiralis]